MRPIIFTALLLGVSTAASASDVWLHVRVQENRHSLKRMAMNVPFRAAAVLARQVPSAALRDCEMEFDDVAFTAADLQHIVRTLQVSPAGVPVEFRFDGGLVRASRINNVLVLRPERWGPDSKVSEVRIPFVLAETVVSSRNQRLNLVRAVELLASRGQGEILFARSDDTVVRIWVDQSPAGNLSAGTKEGKR